MPVQIACPNCGQAASVDDSFVGRTARCGACRTAFAAVPSAPKAAAAAQPLIGGRYQVTGELGRGAFGVAYKALDGKLGKDVAIKMLLPEALHSADAVRRFLQEAELLARLDHPHVVPILDKGTHDGCHYLVCKLVKGKTLADLMAGGGLREPRVIVGHAVTLCNTLHAVYAEHAILHRDVKPANMMLEKGHLYLMDFGMAACHDKDPLSDTAGDEQGLGTVAGTVVGTPAYMPPEQAVFQRDQIGPWSDLYSVGAVLYHFLTGGIPVPWKGSVMDILTVQPLPPSRKRADLDPALDRIVLKSLAKRPADRYRTGAEFAAALQGWLDGTRSGTGTGPAPPIPLPPGPAAPGTVIAKPAKPPKALPPPPGAETDRPTRTARDEPVVELPPKLRSRPRADEPDDDAPPADKSRMMLGMMLAVAGGAVLLIGVCVLVLTLSCNGKPAATGTKTTVWK